MRKGKKKLMEESFIDQLDARLKNLGFTGQSQRTESDRISLALRDTGVRKAITNDRVQRIARGVGL